MMLDTMPTADSRTKFQQIFAAQKIIADISSGLYRSPALLCPVNYLDGGPFEPEDRWIDGTDSVQIPTISDFRVIVDGIEIRRPQLFPKPRVVFIAMSLMRVSCSIRG